MHRLLLACVLLVCAPSAAAESYRELKTELIGNKSADMTTLKRFAKDERAALKDRIKAAKGFEKRAQSPKDKIKAQLLLARLYGLANKSTPRKKVLKKALATAKKGKLKKAQKASADAMKADRALAVVEKVARTLKKAALRRTPSSKPESAKAAKKRASKMRLAKKAAADPKLKKAKRELKAHTAAYGRIGDKVREVRAEAALTLLQLATSSKRVHTGAQALIEAHPEPSRELAPVLADLAAVRSALYAQKGAYKDAALYAMHRDRLSATPLKRSAFEAAAPVHLRSRATSDMCAAAMENDVDCTRIELETFSAVSVSDFSKRKQRRFDPRFSQRVFREYRPLLESCIEASDDLTEFDSEVTLQWTVLSTGRVESLDTRPRHLKLGDTGTCLDAVVKKMRYPRFRGPPASVDYIIEVEYGR